MTYLAARQPGAAWMQEAVSGDADGLGEAHRTVQAQVATARALSRLGPGWQVLHSLPAGPGPATLAHLVVGPGGVFVISSPPGPAAGADAGDGTDQQELAEVRQFAQRVRTVLRRRLSPGADAPTVHPLLCLTDDRQTVRVTPETVPVWRVFGRLLDHPQRLTAGAVQQVAAAAAEPGTWGAPAAEWYPPDLAHRYDAVVRFGSCLTTGTGSRVPDEWVVPAAVTASRPLVATRGLRALAVLTALLGTLSLALVPASPPTLVLGGLTLRHFGWWSCNAKDASLVMVGMGMAAMAALIWWFILLVGVAAAL